MVRITNLILPPEGDPTLLKRKRPGPWESLWERSTAAFRCGSPSTPERKPTSTM